MPTSLSILLVDDNPLFRETLREIISLLHPSWRVVEANNGHEAIDLAHAKLPALILLDYNMPVMSGYDVTIALKGNPETANIPIILMTSDDTDNPLVIALHQLCQAVLFKPFPLRELERLLDRLTGVRAPVNYSNGYSSNLVWREAA